MGQSADDADRADLSADLQKYLKNHAQQVELYSWRLPEKKMVCFTSVPPEERCLGFSKFMQAINELLRAEESGAAFPTPLDFLQLASCSPNAAELLLQDPRSLLEELEMAIIREQEDASKRSAADSALTVKELVRPRLEGKKPSHRIQHRMVGQDAQD